MHIKPSKHRHLLQILAILTVICLLPALPASMSAQEKEVTNLFGSALMDNEETINSVALLKDTLYILTQNGLYTWAPGQEKAQKRVELEMYYNRYRDLEDEEESSLVWNLLVSDGERLLGLDGAKQTLYTLTLEGAALHPSNPLKLDLSDFLFGEEPNLSFQTPEWAKVFEGQLYLKKNNWDDLPTDLYSFDLKTGEKTAHKVKHLAAMTPYRDSKYIVAQLDPNKRHDPETGRRIEPALFIYTPGDGRLEKTESSVPLPMSGSSNVHILYDQKEDALFSFTDTDVYRFDKDMKERQVIGYLPMFNSYYVNGSLLLSLPDGRLVIPFTQNIFLRENNEKGLEGYTVLRMSGGFDRARSLTRTMMEMDKVVLRSVEDAVFTSISEEQLATMFLTRNVPVDIMVLSTNSFDIEKLIEKGYLADLSGSEEITNHLKALPENLQKGIFNGEKAHVLPVSLMAFPLYAHEDTLKELKIDLPDTLKDYVDISIHWAQEGQKKNPDYVFDTDGANLKRSILTQVITTYTANLLGAGEELKFDTPAFKDLIQSILDSDYGELGRDYGGDTPEEMALMEAMWEKKPLFESGMGYEPQHAVDLMRQTDKLTPVMLSLGEGEHAWLDAGMDLLAVMETSENKEVAIQFLTHLLSKLDRMVLAAMNPGYTGPIENPDYDRQLKSNERSLRIYQEQLEKLTGAEKSNLEQSMKYLQTRRERLMQYGKYSATEDELKTLHETVSHFFLFSGLGNAQRKAYWDSYDLTDQMIAGVISLDQFIKQMDDKLRLVRMEYQ